MRKIVAWVMTLLFVLMPLASVRAANGNLPTNENKNLLVTSQTPASAVVIKVDSAPELTAYTLPNGKTVTDQKMLANELSRTIGSSTGPQNIVLSINNYRQAEKMNPFSLGGKAVAYVAGWGFGFKISSYYVRFSLEPGYIGGCIQKNVWHIGMMISRQGSSDPLVDLHLAAWKDKGGPQLGAYNSGSVGRFCYKTNLNYNNVWNALQMAASAVVGAYLGYVVALTAASPTYGELLVLMAL